jgi:tetratricopeptide (TPR) repeat protein|tara:strand:+ start:30750 stop:31610 length:861 start_codon:yes stop_codon:yes gene_type:complete
MQKLIYAFLLTHLCACTFLIDSDVRSAQAIDSYLDAGNIWAANNFYEGLQEAEKSGVAVSKAHVILTTKLSEIRKITINAAEAAVKVSDWKKAIDLYQEQLPLVEIDKAFNTSYQNFLNKRQRERNNLRDSFIVTRAEYLIKAIPVMIADQQLNPYNRKKEQQLNHVKKESKEIASRLLELSFNAMRKKDIATARTMIPLAKKLDDNEAVDKASRTLSTLSQSFDEHLEKMVDEGIQFYSREQYGDALKTWNEILFLDPENDKVKDHKARTQKILQSLEELKQQQR